VVKYARLNNQPSGTVVQLKYYLIATLLMSAPLSLFVGCNKANAPVGLATVSNVKITVPLTAPNGKVLNVNGDVLYYLAGGSAPVTGKAGTVTASSGFSFSFNVPTTASSALTYVAVEISDSTSHNPVAVGATSFSSSTVPVTLGPMNKTVYQANPLGAGQVLNLQTAVFTNMGFTPTPSVASSSDVLCKTTSTGFELDNPALTNSTIAYMGNGDLVKFLQLPASSAFQITSTASKALATTPTDVAPGDVYCVKLIGGGYAWLQITSVTGAGPSFSFRVNTTLNYCGYEPSTADGILIASSYTATPTATTVVSVYSAGATYAVAGSSPYDVALVPNGAAATTIFVSDSASASIFAFPAAGGVSYSFTGTGVVKPIGMAIDSSSSYLYVADSTSGWINQFQLNFSNLSLSSLNGHVNSAVVSAPDNSTQAGQGYLATPRYVAVDTSNNLFVTDTGTSGVADVLEYLAPASIPVSGSVHYWAGSLNATNVLTAVGQVATAGATVIVANSANNSIDFYSLTGASVATSLTSDNNPSGAIPFSNPQGVAYSASQNLLYIADTTHNRIVVMSPSGTFNSIIGSGILSGPTGIKLDGANPLPNLYVADTGNSRVLKFLP
jgi:hypothetical protein